MSLTSYRAAPPRVKPALGTEEQVSLPAIGGRTRGTGVCYSGRCSACLPACLGAMENPLGRPGGDLLFHALRRSTIGAEGFHGRVRDGIGWGTLARTTRSSQRTFTSLTIGANAGAVNAVSAVCRWSILRLRTGTLPLRMDGISSQSSN